MGKSTGTVSSTNTWVGGGGGNGKKTYQTNVTYEPYLDPDSNSTTVKRHLSNDI